MLSIDKAIQDIYDSGCTNDIILHHLKDTYYTSDMKRIIDQFQFDLTYNNNELIIYYAWDPENHHVIEFLLDYGADPRAGDDIVFSNTINYNLLKRLLELGVPPNVHNGAALTNIMYTKKFKSIKLLLDAGINIQNEAMIAAAATGKPDILRLLIEYGGDMDVFHKFVDIRGEEEIFEKNEYIETANLLLSYNVPMETILKYLISWWCQC